MQRKLNGNDEIKDNEEEEKKHEEIAIGDSSFITFISNELTC